MHHLAAALMLGIHHARKHAALVQIPNHLYNLQVGAIGKTVFVIAIVVIIIGVVSSGRRRSKG